MKLQFMFEAIYSQNGLQPQLIWSIIYDGSVESEALAQSLTISVNGPLHYRLKRVE